MYITTAVTQILPSSYCQGAVNGPYSGASYLGVKGLSSDYMWSSMQPKYFMSFDSTSCSDSAFVFCLYSFSVNFACDPCNENTAFHFNPRPNEGVVVRNAKLGDWGEEERDYDAEFPFNPYNYFDALFVCTDDKYLVCRHKLHEYIIGARVMDNANKDCSAIKEIPTSPAVPL